jgi:hypothetical protein
VYPICVLLADDRDDFIDLLVKCPAQQMELNITDKEDLLEARV